MYAKVVWASIVSWGASDELSPTNLTDDMDIATWWEAVVARVPKEHRKEINVIIYVFWNLGKERNIRIFRNASLHPQIVVHLTRQDITTRVTAATLA